MKNAHYPDINLFLFIKGGFSITAHTTRLAIRLSFTLLFFTCAASLAMAQQVNLDSLKSVWKNTALPAVERMDALLGFCNNQITWSTQPDSIILFAQDAYELATRSKLPLYRAKFLSIKGTLLSLTGNDIVNALSYLERCLTIADSLKNDSLKYKTFVLIGIVYNQQSDFSRAIENYLKALTWAEQSGHQELQRRAMNNLASAYAELGEDEKAIQYYNQNLKIGEKEKDTISMLRVLNNLALSFLKRKDAPKALELLTRSLQLSKASGITWSQALIYMNTGRVYEQLNEPAFAIYNYQTSLQIYRSNQNEPGEAEVLVNLARVHRLKQPDSTLILARQALEIAQKIRKKDVLADAACLLSQTYEELGLYPPALAMQKLCRDTRDSIYSEEKQVAIARSEAQYEYEKKQLEDRVAFEQEITKTKLTAQRRYFLLIGLMVLLIVGGYTYFYKRNVKHRAERAEALLKISQLREAMAKQALSASGIGGKTLLNKEKIEAAVASKLGDTSWNILHILVDTPTISNHEIAESLFLSEEGISSSLRRMYSIFDIHPDHSKNHKLALLTKVVELSISD